MAQIILVSDLVTALQAQTQTAKVLADDNPITVVKVDNNGVVQVSVVSDTVEHD